MLKLNLALLIVTLALEVALLSLLVFRKLISQFFFFFLYIACSLVGDAAKTWILGNSTQFYLYYWSIQAIYVTLAYAVVITAFKPALKAIEQRLGIQAFLVPLAIMLFIDFAFWTRFHHLMGTNALAALGSIVGSFEFGFCSLAIAIFLVEIWFEKRRKILQQYRFGILAGFAWLSFSTLVAYFVRLSWGTKFESWFQVVPGFAFMGTMLAWFVTFISERPKPNREDPQRVEEVMLLLEDAIQTAKRIGRRIGVHFRIRFA